MGLRPSHFIISRTLKDASESIRLLQQLEKTTSSTETLVHKDSHEVLSRSKLSLVKSRCWTTIVVGRGWKLRMNLPHQVPLSRGSCWAKTSPAKIAGNYTMTSVWCPARRTDSVRLSCQGSLRRTAGRNPRPLQSRASSSITPNRKKMQGDCNLADQVE